MRINPRELGSMDEYQNRLQACQGERALAVEAAKRGSRSREPREAVLIVNLLAQSSDQT
jgi:hypothetical protein